MSGRKTTFDDENYPLSLSEIFIANVAPFEQLHNRDENERGSQQETKR
jgi:hypothetical protein